MGLLGRIALSLLPLVACVPDVDVDLARVDEPRVLAVAATPAEVAPGDEVTLTALFADGDGDIARGPEDWALCLARRPLAELGPVARECLRDEGDRLVQLGSGPSVATTVPDDACRLFGPDPPEAVVPGEPTGRPVDPDLTGGYYQPIVVRDDEAVELALLQLRLACGVASATQQQAAELRRRYQPNRAPEVLALESEGNALPTTIAAGTRVELRVRWSACPEVPVCGDAMCTLDEDTASCAADCGGELGCPGAESYLRFDPLALELVTARESIGIGWYATDGSFDAARTGRDADDPASHGDNGWTAPERPGPVRLWIVVRDDRGGTSWLERSLEVTE